MMDNNTALLIDKLEDPKEHALTLTGRVGKLEAILSVPTRPHKAFFAMLGHPHSLQGGTMQNKVVTTMARVFKTLGIPSLRFNFRGVGASEGSFDNGIGESEDMVLIAREIKQALGIDLIFAGFSFGSYVTYQAASRCEHRALISIAPPVHHYNYHTAQSAPRNWLIVQGSEDEVVPSHLVEDFVAKTYPQPTLKRFENTGHFFHGKLIGLKDDITSWTESVLNLKED